MTLEHFLLSWYLSQRGSVSKWSLTGLGCRAFGLGFGPVLGRGRRYGSLQLPEPQVQVAFDECTGFRVWTPELVFGNQGVGFVSV